MSRKKFNYEKIKDEFLNKGFILLTRNIESSKQKVECEDFEGYKYQFIYNNLKKNTKKNVRRFNKFNPYVLFNIQRYLDLHYKGTKVISTCFNGSKSPLKLQCSNCGEIFERKWEDIYVKHRFLCHDCTVKKITENKKYNIDFVRKELKKNGYELLSDKYVGNCANLDCMDKNGYKVHIKFSYILNCYNKKPSIFSVKFNEENYIYNINNYFKKKNINCKALFYKNEDYRYGDETTIYCKCECGEIFTTTFSSIKRGQYRCKKCSKSKSRLEKKVQDWLDKKHIYYIEQKRFEGCRNIKPLPFDFYLPNYNCCIEVDGRQHYELIRFSKKENVIESFEKRKKNDNLKNIYCKNNNIKLLRITQEEILNDIYRTKLYKELIEK